MSILESTKPFYEYKYSDVLEYNLKRRLSYALSKMEAFTTKTNGNLVRSDFPNKAEGTVYEGLGKEWLWETDAEAGINKASQIYVDGSSVSGSISFANGMVFLDSAVPTTSEVTCDYSFLDFGIYEIDDPVIKLLIPNYLQSYDSSGETAGITKYKKENRLHLPAVTINTEIRDLNPYEIGGTREVEVFVSYKIYSDKSFAGKTLRDVLVSDYKARIDLFDINNVDFISPFDRYGLLDPSAQQYDELLQDTDLFFGYAYVDKVGTSSDYSVNGITISEVKQTIKGIFR